eukprot:CAMPEP_0171452898 /NCGR_PEP_ID=MMETSP0945-20130129/823_1 /TAXON_ID=109269 /ORGANISM="Vaucheria litorea, Strain CCMP2940" /LENGTH=240 /DNA_ID=CAMNT_0011977659 /DNA_START=1148 /DNA_END=1870 /DNA_ORIENTATION=+
MSLCDKKNEWNDKEEIVAMMDELIVKAICNAFWEADLQFLTQSNKRNSGSTATTALIIGNRLYLSNVGDSRALIVERNKIITSTIDHKPTREDEKLRITKAGGYIHKKRVMGCLAVSRAFGDYEFKISMPTTKEEEDLYSKGKFLGKIQRSKSLVISDPEILVINLTGKEDYIILACDGIFDVFKNEEVVTAVQKELNKHGNPQRCCDNIAKRAIKEKRSCDNVSIILLMLRNNERDICT